MRVACPLSHRKFWSIPFCEQMLWFDCLWCLKSTVQSSSNLVLYTILLFCSCYPEEGINHTPDAWSQMDLQLQTQNCQQSINLNLLKVHLAWNVSYISINVLTVHSLLLFASIFNIWAPTSESRLEWALLYVTLLSANTPSLLTADIWFLCIGFHCDIFSVPPKAMVMVI